MRLSGFFIVVILLLLSLPASAMSVEQGSDGALRTVEDYIKDYIDLPPDAVDWKMLGKTKAIKVDGKTPDGYDFEYTRPEFTSDVRALDGKTVKIKGFMFPLDAAEKQKLFLVGPFPVGCPFHYHVGPSMVVEVHADKKPVAFSYDPVTLTGTLRLVEKDMENSTFYRLENVSIVK